MDVYVECFHDDKPTPAWTKTMPVVQFIKEYNLFLDSHECGVIWDGDEKVSSTWRDPGTGTSMRIEATFK